MTRRRTNRAVWEKAKRIAAAERMEKAAHVKTIRRVDAILKRAAALRDDLDKTAVFYEDNVEDPGGVSALMHAQDLIRQFIEALSTEASDAAVKAAEEGQ